MELLEYRFEIYEYFSDKYVRLTAKCTTTLKKSFQIPLERYFEENQYVIQVVTAHFVPILKCQNLHIEFFLMVKVGYLRNI